MLRRNNTTETVWHCLILRCQSSTIAEKRKSLLIVIDEGPDPTVSVADDAATENSSHLLDAIFVVDGESVIVSFHVVANPDDVT